MKKTVEQAGVVEQTGCGSEGEGQLLTDLAAWRDAIADLASGDAGDDPGSAKHQLAIGTSGLVFNNANLGKVYVSKNATGIWTEKWFVEDPSALLNPISTDAIRVTFESSVSKPDNHPITSKTHLADMDFVYALPPTRADVNQLPKAPTTSTFMDFDVMGKATATSALVTTGGLLREIDNSGAVPKVTDHWILFGTYEPPTSAYAQVRVGRIDKYKDLGKFMNAMLDVRDADTTTSAKWLYAQITYTVDSVPVP